MAKTKTRLPEYDKAETEFMNKVVNGFMAVHPLFGKMPKENSSHRGPFRNVRGENPVDQDFPPISSKFLISNEVVRNTDVEAFTVILFDLASSMIGNFSQIFFSSINEITAATGNVVNAQGKPFSYNHFLDTLEKVEIDFDEKGEPIKPTLVVDPRLEEIIKKITPTPEQMARENEILTRKKAEFYAKKRTRRLS